MGFRAGGDSGGVSIPPRIALPISAALMFVAFALAGLSFGRWLHR